MVPRYSQKWFSIWRPSAILNLINILFSSVHPRNGNMQPRTKFDWNRIIFGWDMEMMLFSKLRPSAILNFWKMQFWPRDLCYQMILYFRSKFRIYRSIWRRYISKKRFSIWRPSTILNFQNFEKNRHHDNWNVHLLNKVDQNRIILSWDMEIMLSSAILNLRKLQFLSRDVYGHVIFHLCSKFRIDRPIWHRNIVKTIFNMASVRHIGFVMTSSYCIGQLHFTFPSVCWIFTAVGFVISEISCVSCFCILAWNCLILA